MRVSFSFEVEQYDMTRTEVLNIDLHIDVDLEAIHSNLMSNLSTIYRLWPTSLAFAIYLAGTHFLAGFVECLNMAGTCAILDDVAAYRLMGRD